MNIFFSPIICVFNFFYQCLTVLVSRSFIFLVKFIPRCFILFDEIINMIVFLILLELLVYRKAKNFYTLTLYPETLLNQFISSKGILVESLGFLYIMSYANRDDFTSIREQNNICLTYFIPIYYIYLYTDYRYQVNPFAYL